MNVLERLRIELAVWSYRWWLDVRGASRRRRRELALELRSNLLEAAGDVGAHRALSGLGSARQMAADAVPERQGRPLWSNGVQAGVAALAAVLLVELLAALAWLDGVIARRPGPAGLRHTLTLFPGSSVRYQPDAPGFSGMLGLGWSCLLVGLLVFVAAARPWRALSRSA